VVASDYYYLAIYHVEIPVLQHSISPAYTQQLWPTSWLAAYNVHSEAEELKEAIYTSDVLPYCSRSPLYSARLEYATGMLLLGLLGLLGLLLGRLVQLSRCRHAG
jgi:hypothetical protein